MFSKSPAERAAERRKKYSPRQGAIEIDGLLIDENLRELIVLHPPIKNALITHSFEKDTSFKLKSPVLKVSLFAYPCEYVPSETPSNNELNTDLGFYTIPLNDFQETTVFTATLSDGSEASDVLIIDHRYDLEDQKTIVANEIALITESKAKSSPFIRAKKGESCFGRSDDRSYFLMVNFSQREAFKMAAAMRLVSQSLCSKLGKFEAALPNGAGDRVWNIRKSQNREALTITGGPGDVCAPGICGSARIRSGRETHGIGFSLDPVMVRSSTLMGIA